MYSQDFMQAKSVCGGTGGYPAGSTSYQADGYFSSGDEDYGVDAEVGQVDSLELLASSDSSDEFVTLGLNEIHVDDSCWSRRELDEFTIEKYKDAVLRGDEMPPIVVSRIQGNWVVLDGVHRLEAYKLAQVHEVKCKVVSIPQGQEPIVVSCRLNGKNGKALSREDYKKVAERFYLKNQGASANKLSAEIGMDVKTFKKYVAPLVAQYKKAKEEKVQQLQKKNLSTRQIEQQLKKEFPHGKGVSSSTVQVAIKKQELKVVPAEAAQPKSGSTDPDTPVVSPALVAGNAITGPCKKSKNYGDITVILGERAPSLMIRHMEFLRPELRSELVEEVISLVNRKRSRELVLREQESEKKAKRALARTNRAA